MPKSNSLKIVPFANGNMLDWTTGKPGEQKTFGYGAYGTPIDWRPNEPFKATLTVKMLERGRSAARIWFEDPDGRRYPMFGQSLIETMQKLVFTNGTAEATWIVVKRGANYGIEIYDG